MRTSKVMFQCLPGKINSSHLSHKSDLNFFGYHIRNCIIWQLKRYKKYAVCSSNFDFHIYFSKSFTYVIVIKEVKFKLEIEIFELQNT